MNAFRLRLFPVPAGRPRPEPRSVSLPELFASYSMLVAAVAFLVYRIVPDRGLEPRFLALDLALAIVLLAGVWYSVSLSLLVIAAVAISYPLAEILRLFFYWLSGDESVWGYWVVTFAGSMTLTLPIWAQIQVLKRERRWTDLPLALASAGLAAIVGLAGLAVVRTSESTPVAPLGSPREGSVPQDQFPPGAPFPTTAVHQLLAAWQQGYETGAARVAMPRVVESVLARPYDPSLALDGCTEQGPQLVSCVLTGKVGFQLVLLETEPSHFVVTEILEMKDS